MTVSLDLLHSLLPQVREDLNIPQKWMYKEITYEYPHVTRVWKQYGENRILLHKLDPIPVGNEPYRHSHPWPSVVEVWEGRYKMGILNADEPKSSEVVIELGPTNSYSMTNPKSWHYVDPLQITYSIMLIGPPYPNSDPFVPKNSGLSLPSSDLKVRNYIDGWKIRIDSWLEINLRTE